MGNRLDFGDPIEILPGTFRFRSPFGLSRIRAGLERGGGEGASGRAAGEAASAPATRPRSC